MEIKTHTILFSFDQVDYSLNPLVLALQQIVGRPGARRPGEMAPPNAREVLIIDLLPQRGQYLAGMLLRAGYQPFVARTALEGFTHFLRGEFVPFAIVLGQEDRQCRFFVHRLWQQVVQKYNWDIPVLRLNFADSTSPLQLQAPATGPTTEQLMPDQSALRRTSGLQSPIVPLSEQSTSSLSPVRSMPQQNVSASSSVQWPRLSGPSQPAQPQQFPQLPQPAQPQQFPQLPQPAQPQQFSQIAQPPIRQTTPSVLPAEQAQNWQDLSASAIQQIRWQPTSPTPSMFPEVPKTPLPRALPPAAPQPSAFRNSEPLPSPEVPVTGDEGLLLSAMTDSLSRARTLEKSGEEISLQGQNLGRYHIKTLLGKGPLGSVYLGYDRLREQDIALKTIQTNILPYHLLEGQMEDINLFQAEADLLGKIDHPHILPILNNNKSYVSGFPFIYRTMPYCSEGSLPHWLAKRETRLTLQEITNLLLQLADALQYAHDRNLLHLNLKPTNIVINPVPKKKGEIHLFVTDFSIVQDGTFFTRHPDNFPYCAPERWSEQASSASDQYSLAALIYELLTGRPPFQAQSEAVFKHLHTSIQPQPPNLFNPKVSPALAGVVLHALEKRPEDRFPTVNIFARTFQRFVGA